MLAVALPSFLRWARNMLNASCTLLAANCHVFNQSIGSLAGPLGDCNVSGSLHPWERGGWWREVRGIDGFVLLNTNFINAPSEVISPARSKEQLPVR